MKRIIYRSIAIQMALLGAVFGEGQLTSAVETVLLEAGTGYDHAVYGHIRHMFFGIVQRASDIHTM